MAHTLCIYLSTSLIQGGWASDAPCSLPFPSLSFLSPVLVSGRSVSTRTLSTCLGTRAPDFAIIVVGIGSPLRVWAEPGDGGTRRRSVRQDVRTVGGAIGAAARFGASGRSSHGGEVEFEVQRCITRYTVCSRLSTRCMVSWRWQHAV